MLFIREEYNEGSDTRREKQYRTTYNKLKMEQLNKA